MMRFFMTACARMRRAPRPAILVALASIGALALAACSSGERTAENPIVNPPDAGANYNGPPPATADIQAFKLNLWDNLQGTNRCGSCHGTNGQAPTFVRSDDINLAYQQALPLVDLANPAESRLVIRVAGGHNCWLASTGACADIMTTWISAWASLTQSGGGRQIELTAPPIFEPGESRGFPEDPSLFATHVWPVLQDHCDECHQASSRTPQQPYFSSPQLSEAYAAARSKIDLNSPERSRLVVRLREEAHNCWAPAGGQTDCEASARVMEQAIARFRDAVPVEPFDARLVASKALGLPHGIEAAGGNRFDTHVIALYEFKTGEGNIAYDTSGVEPALNLTISGRDWEWVGGWGIRLVDGKAQGSTAASRKLYDLITATGEYSIEAWVVPGNVAQEEARIISYSGSATRRNFMLGQTQFSYDFHARSTSTDQNGAPILTTDAADQDLQATLQHVVATYDPVNGRRLYVNGRFTGDLDPAPGGTLVEWDDSFAFVLGNEVSNDQQFEGTFRMVAIHNRALTETQIQQNYEAGVGQKFFLLFNVSELVNMDQAYILFQVSEYDSYAYLFSDPRFISLDETARPNSIPLRGMRIGLNGQLPAVGQAYRTLDTVLQDSQYMPGVGQSLSNIGTVIGIERGPEEDRFFLAFEVLGAHTDVRVEADPDPLPWPDPVARPPDIGLRTFEKMHATMAKLTGVSQQAPAVRATYEQVKQSMPTVESIETFVSAQSVAIAQLAAQYCAALVDSAALRDDWFPGLDANNLGSAAQRAQVINPLVQRMMGDSVGTQPDPAAVRAELDSLIQRLCPAGCSAGRNRTAVKAACTALLGSAATLVN